MASFSREFAVIDTRLEYLELTRAGAMEVFAVDPAELASVHGVPVPEHGAFVGRVLPPESLEGEDAAVLDVQTGAKTRVFRRDAGQATVVPAPRVAPGALRAHESSLVLLNDDWFVLGLRFEVDAEVRRAFNLHGFASLGRGHLRCFVVPEDEDVGARVLVTVGATRSSPRSRAWTCSTPRSRPRWTCFARSWRGPRRRRRRARASLAPSARARDGNRNRNRNRRRQKTRGCETPPACSRTRRARCAGWRRWNAARRATTTAARPCASPSRCASAGARCSPRGARPSAERRRKTPTPPPPPPPPRRATAALGASGPRARSRRL